MGEARKTVLFIVEGPSDKSALENIFQKIYRRDRKIEFKFTNGDITSDPKTTIENVEEKIGDIVNKLMDDQKLLKSDIFQIIQIFDLDGAYIPEAAIKPSESLQFVYSLDGIYCKDLAKVKERNKRKSSIMNYLLSKNEINNIPYEMYFMSCNLDHALYNTMNLDKNEKQGYADAFYEKFLGKEEKFVDFLKTDVVNGVPDTLPSSWRFIKEDLHSLERHTNLHIYFIMHPLPGGLL